MYHNWHIYLVCLYVTPMGYSTLSIHSAIRRPLSVTEEKTAVGYQMPKLSRAGANH